MEQKNKMTAIAIGMLVAGAAIGGFSGFNQGQDSADFQASAQVQTQLDALKADNARLESALATEKAKPAQVVTKEVPVEVIKEVQVPGPEITVEVPVDNDKLAMVLEHIYDNQGEVEYLTDGLDDDEVAMIVDRIAMMNEFKSEAIDKMKRGMARELDKEEATTPTYGWVKFDEDDVDRVRVKDEHDEVIVLSSDLEDGDADLLVTASFEYDNDREYEVDFIVEFRDGELDDFYLDAVREK